MKYLFLPILLFLMVSSCTKYEPEENKVEVSSLEQTPDYDKAKQILTTTCYTCHSPTAGEQGRLAPPMEAVKRRYKMAYSTEKEFIEAITSFAVTPTEDASLMRGAVDRFGVMPLQNFKEEDIRAVATYIYQNELPQPEWFEDHFNQMHPDSGMKMRMRKRMGMGMN